MHIVEKSEKLKAMGKVIIAERNADNNAKFRLKDNLIIITDFPEPSKQTEKEKLKDDLEKFLKSG